MQKCEQPLLTIAIPTYNRAADIAQLLAMLWPQVGADQRVELILSDNASTDSTAEVARKCQSEGMRLRYFRNEVNLGPDGNILRCYEEATGKYVWIFGDDDLILPGGVERILQMLSTHELDIIFCAPCGYVHDYIEEMKGIRSWCPTEVTEDVIRFVRLSTRHHDLVCISAVIVNRDAVSLASHARFDQMLGTHVIQLGWYFTALKNFRKGAFIERGTVVGKMHNSSGGFNAVQVFGVNYAKAVSIFVGDGSKLARTLLDDQLLFWFPANWESIRKIAGVDRGEDYDIALRSSYSGHLRYWLVVFPLMRLPVMIARIWSAVLFVPRQLSRLAVRF